MIDRAMFAIRKQVLLADIGNIAAVRILGKEMVKGLILARADMFRDRFIPFVAVSKYRIDIENHAAKIEYPVSDNVTYGKIGHGGYRHLGNRIHIAYIAMSKTSFNLVLGKAEMIS